MQKPTVERIQTLNQGMVETRNLMETLAIDFHILLKNTIPNLELLPFEQGIGILKKMQITARALYDQFGIAIFEKLQTHSSDILRSLSCYVVAFHSDPFKRKLNMIMPLADDANSGVREFAWMALRPDLILSVAKAIELLEPWSQHESERIRRFASEITRPRGVWCAHIKELRQDPKIAMSLLENLKNDSAKYVQLSVGNWLNDAGKDHPEWVTDVCTRWLVESPSLFTEKICKRARRNLKK